MPNIGPMELAVILLLALLVFGPKKLPEIGRSAGEAMREFRKASRDLMSQFHLDDDPHPTGAVSPQMAPPSEPALAPHDPASISDAAPASGEHAPPGPLEQPEPPLATTPERTH